MQEVIGLVSFCWILKGFVEFWGLLLKPCFCFDVWQLFNQLVGSFGRYFSLGSDPVCSVYASAGHFPSSVCVHDQIAQIAVSELGSRLASLYCGPTAIEADHLESEVLSINITLTIKHDCDDD